MFSLKSFNNDAIFVIAQFESFADWHLILVNVLKNGRKSSSCNCKNIVLNVHLFSIVISFFLGLRQFGKDFYSIQHSKVLIAPSLR